MIEEIVSLWYSYNQHFKAANFYRYLGSGITILTTFLGGVLTYGLIWDGIQTKYMIALAVLISVLAAVRSALRPDEKQRGIREGANEYKDLCEEAKLILQLDFPDSEISENDLETKVRQVDKQRREINLNTPDISSLWYKYVKWRKATDGLAEIKVSETERELVLGKDKT